jgi:hypothetical protein
VLRLVNIWLVVDGQISRSEVGGCAPTPPPKLVEVYTCGLNMAHDTMGWCDTRGLDTQSGFC